MTLQVSGDNEDENHTNAENLLFLKEKKYYRKNEKKIISIDGVHSGQSWGVKWGKR